MTKKMYQVELQLAGSKRVRIEMSEYNGKVYAKVAPGYMHSERKEFTYSKGQATFSDRDKLVEFIKSCEQLLAQMDTAKAWDAHTKKDKKPLELTPELLQMLEENGVDVSKLKPKAESKPAPAPADDLEIDMANMMTKMSQKELKSWAARILRGKK